ncbi:MAG: preprotein translocase subunit SecY [Gammaproteobacteria bacterium]|nr:MAG: preprotein translocase subunit SecY [Gammaproteobacteria bacterium]
MQGGRFTELKRRLLFVLGMFVVFRIGSHIPVPGINPDAIAALFEQQKDTIIGMFNMFSGGSLGRFSVFALGIMPYISAMIIFGLLTKMSPELEKLEKEGASGKHKLTQYKRYATILLAAIQAIGISIALEGQSSGGLPVVIEPGWSFRMTAVLTLVTGTIFLMWLGEQVTERGIGNGISLIIFASIVSGLGSAIGGTLELARTGEMHPMVILLLVVIVLAVTYFVIFMEKGQRRITVHYAKRQSAQGGYSGQGSILPLKVNMAGVIPMIFASALIVFPATVASWFATSGGLGWMQDLTRYLSPGQPLYILLYIAGILFFCFFYTALMFKPKDTAENLKKSGAFIPGVRPGKQTEQFIDKVMTRLTLIAGVYMILVALLPQMLIQQWNVPFYFGGSSLLIVVVVVMDFMAQLQAHLVNHQYDSLLKKGSRKKQGGINSPLLR